jgi:hypothetical protein
MRAQIFVVVFAGKLAVLRIGYHFFASRDDFCRCTNQRAAELECAYKISMSRGFICE